MTNKNFQTHAEYTNYHENRGREIFQKYIDKWKKYTVTYTQNQYDRFDGIITTPNGNILLDIKCREDPTRENDADIWVAQNKIDYFQQNYKKLNCIDFRILIIEPKKKCMYSIHKNNVDLYHNNNNTWKIQKNYPDPTYTKEKVYSYWKKNLKKINLE